MATRQFRFFGVKCFPLLLVGALIFSYLPDVRAQQGGQQGVPPLQESNQAEISEAEQHFRNGVRLFSDGNFREALDEFNRALALDPTMQKAEDYRNRTQAQLNILQTGEDPTEVPQFETFEPEALTTPAESPILSPEEVKIQKVRELVELGEAYLEYDFYEEAVEQFEQALLIAPDNDRAQEGLREAALGWYKERTEDKQADVVEQTQFIREGIEEKKLLPQGADPDGIRNPRITVPRVEERVEVREERSRLEEVLDAEVGVVFEDIHLRDVLSFITENYDINIMVDNRVVAPPPGAEAPLGGPPQPAPPPTPGGGGGGGGGGFGQIGGGLGGGLGQQQQQQQQVGIVTDGMIQYISLRDVQLRQALKALLRPLNLSYSVQPGFVWISTPEIIRTETFEDLETRFYELRNAGAETLFKVVVTNEGGPGGTIQAGLGGGGGGGLGGGGGGFGGGGGGLGGGGGGLGGGGGGLGGGGGGFGGGGGGLGGGGGGFGGGGGGLGGGGGGGLGGGGGGGGGIGGAQFPNISELFGTFPDEDVGEFPSLFSQLTGGGGGGGGGFGGGGLGGGAGLGGGQGGQTGGFGGPPGGQAGLGAAAGLAGEPSAMYILRNIVGDVVEPVTGQVLSFMFYNILTNHLIVHNTPSNHRRIVDALRLLDETPKQVSIEAKFLTIGVNDLEKQGFRWEGALSDLNTRQREIPGITDGGDSYPFDINGDGILEDVPFNIDPDNPISGVPLIRNNIVESMLDAVASPGPPGAFSLSGILTDNEDGDFLQVTFDFLDSLQETELLSAPRVTTMNQKPAVIADFTSEFFLIRNDTFVQQVATGAVGGETVLNVIQNPQFQQFVFGITLSVTPQISGDQIRLWLNPQVVTKIGEREFEVTSEIGGEPFTTELAFPLTTTQSVWTNVIVHDGDTLVLGGLVTDETQKGEERMPYLSKIPVLGFLFRGKSREVRQQSLLIFVTTDVIDTTGSRYFESELQ